MHYCIPFYILTDRTGRFCKPNAYQNPYHKYIFLATVQFHSCSMASVYFLQYSIAYLLHNSCMINTEKIYPNCHSKRIHFYNSSCIPHAFLMSSSNSYGFLTNSSRIPQISMKLPKNSS